MIGEPINPADGVCTACGHAFSPRHDSPAPGPTVTHPFMPALLGRRPDRAPEPVTVPLAQLDGMVTGALLLALHDRAGALLYSTHWINPGPGGVDMIAPHYVGPVTAALSDGTRRLELPERYLRRGDTYRVRFTAQPAEPEVPAVRHYIALLAGLHAYAKLTPREADSFKNGPTEPIEFNGGTWYPVSAEIADHWTADEDDE